MAFLDCLSSLYRALCKEGLTEEARLIERVAHYVPEDISGVPTFFRRNYDYGEGFYHGDMSEKPGIKEWREKSKGKSLNMPKKKKKKKGKKAAKENIKEKFVKFCKTDIQGILGVDADRAEKVGEAFEQYLKLQQG